jgi:ParB family transcriptional regulator, chromosome partitioning protein
LSATVVADGFNPRDEFDKAELERLTASVKQDGLLQPLLLAPPVDGEYRLVDGERRYRACIEAALIEVPVLVRATDEDTQGLDFALLANSLRVDLNPVEEAQAFKRLIDDGGLTRRGVAEKYMVTQKCVTERLRILEVPAELHPAIADGSVACASAVGWLDSSLIIRGWSSTWRSSTVARSASRGSPACSCTEPTSRASSTNCVRCSIAAC